MALTDKLTAIANAIRSKTGGTSALTLDGMVTAINSIETGGGGGGGASTTGEISFSIFSVASGSTEFITISSEQLNNYKNWKHDSSISNMTIETITWGVFADMYNSSDYGDFMDGNEWEFDFTTDYYTFITSDDERVGIYVVRELIPVLSAEHILDGMSYQVGEY